MQSIKNNFKEFENIDNPPKEIFFIGDKELLNKRKISIVGTRKPNPYTKTMIHKISQKLSSKIGFCEPTGGSVLPERYLQRFSAKTADSQW